MTLPRLLAALSLAVALLATLNLSVPPQSTPTVQTVLAGDSWS